MPGICNADDVVNITITGVRVVRIAGNLIFTDCADYINVNDPKVSVEVARQLPTEAGSQIRYTDNNGYVHIITLNTDGDWINQHEHFFHPDTIRGYDFQVRKDEWE